MKCRLLFLVVFTFSISVPVIAQTPRYARVISANANLRDTPSISSGNQQEIAEDTVVKVLDEKLPWYVVRAGNRVGWMHGNTIEFMETLNSRRASPHQQTVVPDHQPPPVPRRDGSPERTPRGTSVDRGYITGPRGGCYYLSGSGRKVYVDRSLCN
jgi:hypothetical protein